VATANELRNLDDAALREQLQGCYEELFNLRFQKVTGSVSNTARPRQVKKDIARIKTVLRERALAQE
jgi:large subunit ribosomal protein L29